MKAMHPFLTTFFAMTVFTMGCSERGSSPAPEKASSPGPVAVEAAPDRWLGKWNGPEGTFLLLTGGNGKYEVTIQNLDGPRKFQGTGVAAGIEFERDGAKEVIRSTNGTDTGMKWLAGKSTCLTVRMGEGYCKD